MKQLHKIQRDILQRLLFSPSLRYLQMKPESEMENNRFDFHLKKLMKLQFVEKDDDRYFLTSKGKDYANRIDPDNKKLSLQAKITLWICAVRKIDGKEEYLIYTRLKNPFYGGQGFMTGKLQYGEKVLDGVKREFKEETNLTGDPKIVSIRHYLVKEKKSHKLVEDKFMILCKVENPEGKLKGCKEGKYEWVERNDFKKNVTNHFESYEAFKRDIRIIDNFDGKVLFEEFEHFTEMF